MSRLRTCSHLNRVGFTLIELVLVMVILATLAALVIPRLGFLQAEATPVSGMASSQDLMNNLETYKVSTGFYPLRFDSLLTQSGALIPQLWGMAGGASQMFVATPSFDSADPYLAGSWGMAFGNAQGVYTIMDQDATINDVNASFNTRALQLLERQHRHHFASDDRRPGDLAGRRFSEHDGVQL